MRACGKAGAMRMAPIRDQPGVAQVGADRVKRHGIVADQPGHAFTHELEILDVADAGIETVDEEGCRHVQRAGEIAPVAVTKTVCSAWATRRRVVSTRGA